MTQNERMIFRLCLAFGVVDPEWMRQSMPCDVLMQWSRFYDESPWGCEIDDMRAEVGRLRHLLCEYGEDHDSMPDWKWPYTNKNDAILRDPLTLSREMKARELERRKKAAENADRDCSSIIDPTACEPCTTGEGIRDGSGRDI